nr:Biomphalaria glabrata sperm-associated antigen 17-like [Biomphalaria glabrata]
MTSRIGFRKKKLNTCIEAIEKNKEIQRKAQDNLKEKASKEDKIDLLLQIKLLESDLKYKDIFISLAKEEQKREELYKNKAMKIILATCVNNEFENEEQS